MIALGLLLLGHLASPQVNAQSLVTGTVKSINTRYVKGIGNFYDLSLSGDDGSESSVMIANEVATRQAVDSLVGRHIQAHVNRSLRALDLSTQGSLDFDPDRVRQASENASARYQTMALFMALFGTGAGLAYLYRATFR